MGSHSLLQGTLPNPGIESGFPPLQADSAPSEPPGKPEITGVGSLPLLQRIFPTQESDWGLLRCRWILYQLSYQGSPMSKGYQEGKAVHADKLSEAEQVPDEH